VTLRWDTLTTMAETVHAERNFYGALQVIERDAGEPSRHRFELTNGGILHGAQFTESSLRRIPTAYYGASSGLAAGVRAARDAQRAAGRTEALRIGCVGLGVGVIAAHTVPGDDVRYYELNPPWRGSPGATSASSLTLGGAPKSCSATRASRWSGNWPPRDPGGSMSSSWTRSPATRSPPTC
jgi:hypothetical protein